MGYELDEMHDTANEVRDGFRTAHLDWIREATQECIDKYRLTCSNEQLAELAYDAWCDACEGCSVESYEHEYAESFPELYNV
jgi:hypothetical protein